MHDFIFLDLTSATVITLAVFLVGLSKGGFGGAFGLLGVPILAFIMPPLEAAALLLPIYLFMDAVSLWAWRGHWSKPLIWAILPMAIVGIGIGWMTASIVSDEIVGLIIGSTALLFVFQSLILKVKSNSKAFSRTNIWSGRFWGLVSGFSSFIAHAGGPPFQIYAMPLRLDPKIFAGSSVLIFSVLNFIKIGPYLVLGRLNTEMAMSSVIFIPVAVGATLLGAFIVRRMEADLFYPIMYTILILVSVRLIIVGIF